MQIFIVQNSVEIFFSAPQVGHSLTNAEMAITYECLADYLYDQTSGPSCDPAFVPFQSFCCIRDIAIPVLADLGFVLRRTSEQTNGHPFDLIRLNFHTLNIFRVFLKELFVPPFFGYNDYYSLCINN